MNEEAKEMIRLHLEMLRKTLIENEVSMATDGNNSIYFIDTKTYLSTGEKDGFTVNVSELVK